MNPDDFIPEDEIEVVPEPAQRAGLMERILSPESLQKMMMCGGGLLVVGFVVWLWSIGLFANPVTVALIIGSATLGTIAGGILLYSRTRYRQAGTGLTLLGSLALPLNLWFYDAQGLMTLANGGHLWIPAALCCVIYTVVAWVMRNSRFVYAIVGGVVMTGMLFLADATINQFWYLMPQVTFLVGVGWACLAAARQFPEGDGDFSRDNFGRAFSRAGALVLTAGLLLLGGGQAAAILSATFTYLTPPLIATMQSQQLWATAILIGSSVGFAVEHLLRKSRGGFGFASVVTGVWGGVTLIDVLGIRPSVGHLVIGLSVLVTAVNLLSGRLRVAKGSDDETSSGKARFNQLTLATEPLAFLLAAAAVVSFCGQLFTPGGNLLFSPTGWTLVIQLASSAAAIWSTVFAVGRNRRKDEQQSRSRNALAFVGAATVTLTVWTTGMVMGWSSVVPFAAAGLLPPLAVAGTACVLKDESARSCCRCSAWGFLNTALLLVVPFAATGMISTASPHVVACGISAVAAIVFYLAAASRGRLTESFFGHVASGIGFSQALALAGVDASYALAVAPTIIGVGLTVLSRLVQKSPEADQGHRTPVAPGLLVLAGNALGVLLTCTRLVTAEQTLGLIGMLSFQLAATTVVGLMARTREWKLAFRAAAITLVVTLGFTVNGLIHLGWLHRLELMSLMGGAALLTLGYVAWSREGDEPDEMATAGLSLGSLAMVLPLAVGLVSCRLADTTFTGWWQFHEVAAIVVGVALLGSGLLCRIRSTTVGGAALLGIHLLSLVTLITWPEALQSVSVLMMLGGGLFFGTAILLSIYRDRLLSLPGQIREGHGVFRVFKWR